MLSYSNFCDNIQNRRRGIPKDFGALWRTQSIDLQPLIL